MSGKSYQDLAAMKKLLTSWQVLILYDAFKEEDISINELKILEFRHIHNLLNNYKTGVRIRFEYHFNNWRNTIGLPLKPDICCCRYKTNQDNNNSFMECHNMENSITNTTTNTDDFHNDAKRKRHNHNVTEDLSYFNESQPQLSPQSAKSDNSESEMIDNSPAPAIRCETPNLQSNKTDDEEEMDNLNILVDLISSSVKETKPKFPSKQILDRSPVNLAQILQSSGTRGLSIVNFYKKKKHLTNVHRTQLIQTIVDFFDENDIHLSLNMSHNLESEIMKMFPTETMEYYRTEKRGKIYVKFSNMKRYKRERNNKVNSEIENISRRTRQSHTNDDNVQSIDENGVEQDVNNYEGWPIIAEPEVIVKEENFVEYDENLE
ncbi:uncharacterized protein LOC135960678 [Calliphora vicina]|uniref:uncharacterized protein LOC135960678 n=1 Tax=Calliphora vicina TaxID=7373 RepID=UPI00325B8F1E